MAKLLGDVAVDSPVRQARYEFAKRAREWNRAAKDAQDVGDEGVIEFVGSVGLGMSVFFPTDASNWAQVVRVMERNGQTTLHLEHPYSGQAVYQNFCGPTSPVVVKA